MCILHPTQDMPAIRCRGVVDALFLCIHTLASRYQTRHAWTTRGMQNTPNAIAGLPSKPRLRIIVPQQAAAGYTPALATHAACCINALDVCETTPMCLPYSATCCQSRRQTADAKAVPLLHGCHLKAPRRLGLHLQLVLLLLPLPPLTSQSSRHDCPS